MLQISKSKEKLGCYRRKADKLSHALELAATALQSENDAQYTDVVDCPSQEEVEDTFAGIRRHRNLIKAATESLEETAPGALKSLQGSTA